jgi:hypothetical protein
MPMLTRLFIVEVETMTHICFRIYRIKSLPGYLKWRLSKGRKAEDEPERLELQYWAEERNRNR